MKKYLSIEKAEYLNDYKIFLRFNDGKEVIVDFEQFITKSQHPDIKKYRELKLFKKFKLEYGEIEWNNYDLVFPIYDLYQQKITYT